MVVLSSLRERESRESSEVGYNDEERTEGKLGPLFTFSFSLKPSLNFDQGLKLTLNLFTRAPYCFLAVLASFCFNLVQYFQCCVAMST